MTLMTGKYQNSKNGISTPAKVRANVMDALGDPPDPNFFVMAGAFEAGAVRGAGWSANTMAPGVHICGSLGRDCGRVPALYQRDSPPSTAPAPIT